MIYRLTKSINQTAKFHSCHIVLHLHQILHDHCRSSHKAGITFEVHYLGAFKYKSSHQLINAYINLVPRVFFAKKRQAFLPSFLMSKRQKIWESRLCLYCSRIHFSHALLSPVCVPLVFPFLIAFSSSYFFILENPVILK